jgi:hypothetical protein
MRDRASAMLERVTLESTFHMGKSAAAMVRAAAEAALAVRDARVDGDHDPRLLHPARTVLILLSDAACRDAELLAAALFVETVDAELQAPLDALAAAGGGASRRLAESVPVPAGAGDEDLLERLVTAPPQATVVAVAERLDHARHLHLRQDLPWPEFHGVIERCYLPAAQRVSPPLARRLERWAEAFRVRRLLRQERRRS